MYAIIKTPDESFYTSVVFGHFRKYRDYDFDDYYLVLNEEKTSLIMKLNQPPELHYLMPQVLVVDTDQSGWELIEDKVGYRAKLGVVDFLAHINFDSKSWEVPDDLLQRCIKIDTQQQYCEFVDVETEADLKNLDWVTGSFHDGVIQRRETRGDSFYVYFDSLIGCKAELWFSGDVAFNLDGTDPNDYYPYWDHSGLFMEDGFIYLAREGVSQKSEMPTDCCYIRGKKLQYRIIPIYRE